jgi:hypothetical protein
MENMNNRLYATRALLFRISLVAREQQHHAQLVATDANHGARRASTMVDTVSTKNEVP